MYKRQALNLKNADVERLAAEVADIAGETKTEAVRRSLEAVSYTHLRAHETPEHLVCRLLLEKKNQKKTREDEGRYIYDR